MAKSGGISSDGTLSPGETDSVDQDIAAIMRETPSLNDLSSTVQSGKSDRPTSQFPPNQRSTVMPHRTTSSSPPVDPICSPFAAPSSIPLSSPDRQNGGSGDARRFSAPTSPSAASKLDSFKNWSINTYKCTRQMLSEKLGKANRTIDTELEAQIDTLRDTQKKYSNILRLARSLTCHFQHVVQTQKALGDCFSDLSQKNPELQKEFKYNADTQHAIGKNGEYLLGALNFFTSSVNTLCNKTMEDTILTIKSYEAARIEYDAYRWDMESLQMAPRDHTTNMRLEEANRNFSSHKEKYEKLKADVAIKIKFLEENKVKVMHKQLLLFHNAVASYFSGNQKSLESTLKQFNIKLTSPNSEAPSWIESSN